MSLKTLWDRHLTLWRWCISTDSYARTAIVAHNGNWDIAMSQFNAESAEHVRDDLYFRKRRDKLCGYTRTRTKKQVVQD